MFATDRDLIRAVIAGDARAGDQFVVRFSRYVYGVLYRSFRLRAEVAEELYQELFLRLWEDDYRRLRMWRGEGDFVGYLAPIVRNLALDRLRREPEPRRDESDENEPATGEPDPEELAALDERRRLVEGAVEELGERDRELYRRRFVEEQKHREIAQAMDMQVGHVGVALMRLEAKLVRLVGEDVRSAGAGASPEQGHEMPR